MQERCQEESKEHFYSSGDYSKFYQKAGEESMYCQKKSSRCQISDYWSETRPQSVFTSLVLEGGPGPGLRAMMHRSSQKPSALEVNSSAWLTNRVPPVSWEYSIWEFLLLLFLTVEKYWSCSIKRIKLTTVCVWGCVYTCVCVHVYMCMCTCVCVCMAGPGSSLSSVSRWHGFWCMWGTGTHTSQEHFLCTVLSPSFFLVSADTVILTIWDLSGAPQPPDSALLVPTSDLTGCPEGCQVFICSASNSDSNLPVPPLSSRGHGKYLWILWIFVGSTKGIFFFS